MEETAVKNENGILISVVIPTYRRADLLGKCLDALSKQDLSSGLFEVLVISDGPDSVTKKAIDLYAHTSQLQLRYLSLSKRKGPAAARNTGWKNACGNLIAFTDDDCLPEPGWLKNIWDQHRMEPLIAYTGKVCVPLPPNPTDHQLNTAGLENGDFLTANCACTRQALEKVGGFDERFKMAWREDSDLQFRLILHHIPIRQIDEAIVVHPSRKATWGISIKEQKKGMFNALLYKKFPALYREKIRSTPPWSYFLSVIFFIGALSALLSGNSLIAGLSSLAWLLITFEFTHKRLKPTSKTPAHILEMLISSMIIPFVAVFWQLYGSVRYGVLFIYG